MAPRWPGVAGALFGAAGVMLGAFGAHALKNLLAPDQLEVWRTAVLYHLIHALALLACYACAARPGVRTGAAGVTFAVGIVLFSGSLYALALGGPRWLGPVTPLGGVAFIVGWVLLGVSLARNTSAGDGHGSEKESG